MPPLPKQLKRREANITPLVATWFLENWEGHVAIEVKVGKNPLLPHQALALEQVSRGRFKYKIPDMGMKNPFDLIVLKQAEAFVVRCDGHLCHAVSNKHDFTFKVKAPRRG